MTSDRTRLEPGSQASAGATLVIVPPTGQAIPASLDALFSRLSPAPALSLSRDIDTALSQGDDQVLVILDAPVSAIRRLLADGLSAEAALEEWVEQSLPLMRLLRRERRRLALVETRVATDSAELLTESLCARYQLAARTTSAAGQFAPQEPELAAVESLEHLLAIALLSGNTEAAGLADELEAMFLQPGPSRSVPLADMAPIDTARHALRRAFPQTGPGRKRWDDLALLAEELSLLREALDQMSDALERGATARRLQTQRVQAAAETLEHHSDQQRLQRETVLARMLLARDNLLQDHEQLKDELSRVHTSHSWRLTRPLRACSRVLSRVRTRLRGRR